MVKHRLQPGDEALETSQNMVWMQCRAEGWLSKPKDEQFALFRDAVVDESIFINGKRPPRGKGEDPLADRQAFQRWLGTELKSAAGAARTTYYYDQSLSGSALGAISALGNVGEAAARGGVFFDAQVLTHIYERDGDIYAKVILSQLNIQLADNEDSISLPGNLVIEHELTENGFKLCYVEASNVALQELMLASEISPCTPRHLKEMAAHALKEEHANFAQAKAELKTALTSLSLSGYLQRKVNFILDEVRAAAKGEHPDFSQLAYLLALVRTLLENQREPSVYHDFEVIVSTIQEQQPLLYQPMMNLLNAVRCRLEPDQEEAKACTNPFIVEKIAQHEWVFINPPEDSATDIFRDLHRGFTFNGKQYEERQEEVAQELYERTRAEFLSGFDDEGVKAKEADLFVPAYVHPFLFLREQFSFEETIALCRHYHQELSNVGLNSALSLEWRLKPDENGRYTMQDDVELWGAYKESREPRFFKEGDHIYLESSYQCCYFPQNNRLERFPGEIRSKYVLTEKGFKLCYLELSDPLLYARYLGDDETPAAKDVLPPCDKVTAAGSQAVQAGLQVRIDRACAMLQHYLADSWLPESVRQNAEAVLTAVAEYVAVCQPEAPNVGDFQSLLPAFLETTCQMLDNPMDVMLQKEFTSKASKFDPYSLHTAALALQKAVAEASPKSSTKPRKFLEAAQKGLEVTRDRRNPSFSDTSKAIINDFISRVVEATAVDPILRGYALQAVRQLLRGNVDPQFFHRYQTLVMQIWNSPSSSDERVGKDLVTLMMELPLAVAEAELNSVRTSPDVISDDELQALEMAANNAARNEQGIYRDLAQYLRLAHVTMMAKYVITHPDDQECAAEYAALKERVLRDALDVFEGTMALGWQVAKVAASLGMDIVGLCNDFMRERHAAHGVDLKLRVAAAQLIFQSVCGETVSGTQLDTVAKAIVEQEDENAPLATTMISLLLQMMYHQQPHLLQAQAGNFSAAACEAAIAIQRYIEDNDPSLCKTSALAMTHQLIADPNNSDLLKQYMDFAKAAPKRNEEALSALMLTFSAEVKRSSFSLAQERLEDALKNLPLSAAVKDKVEKMQLEAVKCLEQGKIESALLAQVFNATTDLLCDPADLNAQANYQACQKVLEHRSAGKRLMGGLVALGGLLLVGVGVAGTIVSAGTATPVAVPIVGTGVAAMGAGLGGGVSAGTAGAGTLFSLGGAKLGASSARMGRKLDNLKMVVKAAEKKQEKSLLAAAKTSSKEEANEEEERSTFLSKFKRPGSRS